MTHALLAGSPAFNGGENTVAAGLTTDQRGTARIVGVSVDIGAIEVQRLTARLDGSDNLVIEETLPNGSNDVFTIRSDGAGYLVISEATGAFENDGGIPGAVLTDSNKTLTIPISSVPGIVVINANAGDDLLTVDLTLPLGKEVTFNGGTGGNDSMALTGGTATDIRFTFINLHDGSVNVDAQVIRYTGLGPINSIDTMNVTRDYSDMAETITVRPFATDPTRTEVTSTAGEAVDFANPTGLLTINLGDAGDNTIDIDGFGTGVGGMTASFTIRRGTGFDTMNLNTALTLAADQNVSFTADTINQVTAAT